MERRKTLELIDKCKDRTYIQANKQDIKDAFSKPKSIEVLRNELSSKKSGFILSILEKIDYDFDKIIHNLEVKRYITQFMYSSIYYMYKNRHITPEQFAEIQEQFKPMKNSAKMFEDISRAYKMERIEADWKRFKHIKNETNKIKNRTEEITELVGRAKPLEAGDFENIKGIETVDIFTVILNVDDVFDLSMLNFVEAEEGKVCISEIKRMYSTYIGADLFSLSKLQCIDPDSDQSIEDIPEEKELCETYVKVDKSRMNFNRRQNYNLSFSNLDRMLSHRISKLHGLVHQLQRNGIEVYMVSCVSLTQLLAEITFFEFTTLELCNIFSLRSNKEDTYNKIMTMITGRTIVLGESTPFKNDNIYSLDYKHLKDLVTNLEQKNRM
ncbi:hypothetical protein NGRA_0639 [Nosema granulosis]|uniref:Uncharacterized protein n=1 Tax=Nosema granulosis TaxID=83296 RepID=A0A9P6GZY0_9MICR|nr:hypothetical protein NGRA_0639 [Nosema granulosis]